MAIANYGELKSAIADFMNRSDMTTAQTEYFVTLVEADIRNDVRIRAMEATTAITVTSQTVPAPAAMLDARELAVGGYAYQFVPKSIYTDVRKGGGSSKVFTSHGQNFLVNIGDTTAVVDLTYTAALDAFTASTNTNYILTTAPDVYLYGACAHASQYYQDAANLERFKALYMGAIDRLNKRENKARWAGSMLQIFADNVE